MRFNATNAAPPGMPVHAPGPHGFGTTIQSKFLPICFSIRADLPASRQVEHDAAVGELLERIAVGRAADAAPDFLGHRAVAVPVVELLRHRLVAVVDDEIALGVEDLRALADRGAGEAMAAAVERHRERRPASPSRLAASRRPSRPTSPSGRAAATLACSNSVLLTNGPVTVSCVIMPVDALVGRRRAQPLQRLAEIRFPALRVLHVRRDVEVVLRRGRRDR